MIVKLIYQDKQRAPYITRATFRKPPGTIIHDDAVFQNCNIVYVNNNKDNPIYQYREVPSVLIKEIELVSSVPIKFKPAPE
ncbi:hypothetical protein QUB56_09825 [Microcoleus sp. AR_TQ3_B6]|uniref:hypothetical protein n=1 Tax=Microcoleus sp. AR_TQ3_B6 TaxID=3055284 RepID=UPI002FD4A4C8